VSGLSWGHCISQKSALQRFYNVSRHCKTLRHTARHCKTLQHPSTHCKTLQQHTSITRHCKTLQDTARHCKTLQDTARHCNTLQHTATHCNNTLLSCLKSTHRAPLHTKRTPTSARSTLQHIATTHFQISQKYPAYSSLQGGWRGLIGCRQSQVIFRKRATNSRALLLKMTYEVQAS